MSVTESEAPPRRLTESQIEAILALPEHDDAPVPTSEARRPARVYTDEAHFQLERATLLRRMPIPLTVSAMLPKPKMAFAMNRFGLPILLTRDAAGVVHAFLNACTHRGSKVVEAEEPHACSRMTCPYHAWTYDMGGQLIGVPRAEVFPTLNKSEQGLRRLPVSESGGLIWVGLDPDHEPDFSDTKGQLTADLDAFGLPGMHVFARKTYDLKANWKILIETFLETYHVPPLHKNTVAQFFAEVPTIFTWMGPHSRQTTGRSHFTRADLDLDVSQLHKLVTHAYQLFPTAMLVTSPYHFNFVTVAPLAANRTIVDCYLVTPGPATTPKLQDLYERSFEYNMTTVFGNEDFRAAEMVQAGLDSGAISTVYFGGLEKALDDYHRTIDTCMEG